MFDTKRFTEMIDSAYRNLLTTHDEITDIKLTEDRTIFIISSHQNDIMLER